MQVCELGKKCTPHFVMTGYNGKVVWNHIHREIPKMIDCEECADHAKFEFKGLHDHVNAGLKKPIHDMTTYAKWVKEVNDTFDLCVKEGRCKIEHSLS
jgi:hypothetical protein